MVLGQVHANTVENPRGHQAGRMGKAKVKMMMIVQIIMNMYMETT